MLTLASSQSSAASFVPVRRSLSRADYEHFLPMVRRMSMSLARRLPRSVSIDDLASAGWIGVAEAFSRADVAMPIDELDAFVSRRVKGAMIDYLRSISPKARMTRSVSRRIERAVVRATSALGRAPQDIEIAAELGVSVEEYRAMIATDGAATVRCEMVDLDDVDGNELANDTISADDAAHRSILVARVAELIPSMPERTQKVLMLYYQESCTLKEIGAILGVTESRVSQIHSEAMKTLRASLADA